MTNTYSIKSSWLRLGLYLSVAGFLLSVFLVLSITSAESIGEIQVRLPQPPHIGNSGKVTLDIYSWRLPDKEQLQIAPVPDGLDFSEWRLRLGGISRKGFLWHCGRFFWAVQFGEYGSLDVSWGPVKQRLPLQLKILPRPDLGGLEIPPEPPAPSDNTLLILLCIAVLAMLSDLLLAIWRWHRPPNRVLRQLSCLPANAAGCTGLRQIWQRFTAPSSLRNWLGAEIRKMQFSPGGLTKDRFALCKALLVCELSRCTKRKDPPSR